MQVTEVTQHWSRTMTIIEAYDSTASPAYVRTVQQQNHFDFISGFAINRRSNDLSGNAVFYWTVGCYNTIGAPSAWAHSLRLC